MKINKRPAAAGFTFIEVIVVVGIIGIFLVASFPSILNTMESRNLENNARRIQTYLQQTKNRAVDTKITHRVRFTQVTDAGAPFWAYDMERLAYELETGQAAGTWVKAEGAPRKDIPAKFAITLALPTDGGDFVVYFSSLGMIGDLDFNKMGAIFIPTNTQYSITLRSPKLDRQGQMDLRVLNLFMGGSIQYLKQKS